MRTAAGGWIAAACALLLLTPVAADPEDGAAPAVPQDSAVAAAPKQGTELSATGQAWIGRLREAIERNLGRPYVWGATGLKSFDCSGFVWRVLQDSGVLIKRTTARKYYMSLRPVPRDEAYSPANLVFFDNLKHCGIVNDSSTFWHSQCSMGTNLSSFDPYWRQKIYGFRRMPVPPPPPLEPAP